MAATSVNLSADSSRMMGGGRNLSIEVHFITYTDAGDVTMSLITKLKKIVHASVIETNVAALDVTNIDGFLIKETFTAGVHTVSQVDKVVEVSRRIIIGASQAGITASLMLWGTG